MTVDTRRSVAYAIGRSKEAHDGDGNGENPDGEEKHPEDQCRGRKDRDEGDSLGSSLWTVLRTVCTPDPNRGPSEEVEMGLHRLLGGHGSVARRGSAGFLLGSGVKARRWRRQRVQCRGRSIAR